MNGGVDFGPEDLLKPSGKHLHHVTPCQESIPLTNLLQDSRKVFLKYENLQPSYSFKLRGVGLLCQHALKSGCHTLVCSSGGNAGYACAFAGKALHLSVRVILPSTTSSCIKDRLTLLGAKVQCHGPDWDTANALAVQISKEPGMFYIPPFDHPVIWEGNASIVKELYLQLPNKPDVVVLSVGGGGLLCGVIQGLDSVGWSDVPVIAVETCGADSLSQSMEMNRLVTLSSITSLATSLGAKTVCAKAFELASTHPVFNIVVKDEDAINACQSFLGIKKLNLYSYSYSYLLSLCTDLKSLSQRTIGCW
eukprot:Sdes_comp16175_c0_seq1m5421